MNETKKSTKASKKQTEDTKTPETDVPSAPVIVTSRPIMKHQASTEDTDDDTDKAEEVPVRLSSSKKTKIQPLEDSVLRQDDKNTEGETQAVDASEVKDIDSDAKADGGMTGQPSGEDLEEEPSGPAPEAVAAEAEPNNEPDAADIENKESAESRASETDKQKSPVAQQAKAEVTERTKRDETVQKLVASRQYFLPIRTNEERKSRKVVITGVVLSVLLVLAWVDIALDTGIIHVGGLEPLTHFFSN